MNDAKLTAAYAACRAIARREARNFYYSFLALPVAKRNALSAVYAFMRHADDLSDDEKLSVDERRQSLNAWVNTWHRVERGEDSNDPVFVALADTQRRFGISSELLDQLVQGTSMDLEIASDEAWSLAAAGAGTAVAERLIRKHRTFADLYRYCYLVASVVGLVCIRIYGYDDPHAEQLAERCGVAFQLTNIIRDVKEDAAMGRVYLPEEDLARFGLNVEDFLHDGGPRVDQKRLSALLEFEAQRAREYYQSGMELIPLIHRDSRPALWVIVNIYKRLLEKIGEDGYNVLDQRVRLSTAEKFGFLARGIIKSDFHTL